MRDKSNTLDPDAIIKILPLIRLPFPEGTWIEYPATEYTAKGTLLLRETLDKDKLAIYIIGFAEAKGRILGLPPFGFHPSESKVAIDEDGENKIQFTHFCRDREPLDQPSIVRAFGAFVTECIAALAFINSPNIATAREIVPPADVNLRRVKKGKTWLNDYK